VNPAPVRPRPACPWPLLAVGGPLLPVLTVLASGRTLVWRDTAKLFAPMRTLITEALRSGELPLWNPHEAMGMPLLAQWLHGVLHPVSLAAVALPPAWQADFMLGACVALAAGGAYACARVLDASRPASACAGVVFGASGYVLGIGAVLQYLVAAASGPWTVAGLVLCARRPAPGVLAASAAVAFQAFAGDPQWALVSVALGLALALSVGGHRVLVPAGIAVGLGLLLGAVQLVPAWTFLGQTSRQLGLSRAEQAQWALHPLRLLELGLPGLLAGQPGPPVAPLWASLEAPGARTPFLPSVHVGAVALALAVSGARSGRTGRVLSGATVALAWLALGHHLGARQLLAGVPVWGSIRYAEKLTGPLTLALALAASLGADRLSRGEHAERAGKWLRVSGIAGVALAAVALAVAALRDHGDIAELAVGRAATGLGVAGMSAIAAGAAVLALCRRGRAERVPATLVVILLATSVAGSPFALRAGDRSARTAGPLMPPDASSELVRLGSLADVTLTDLDSDAWDRVAAVECRAGTPSYNVASRVDQLSAYTGLNPLRFMTLMDGGNVELGHAKWQFWRRYALTHVAVSDDRSPEVSAESRLAVAGGEPVARDVRLGVTLYAVPHRSWASFAPAALAATDASDAVHRAVEAWRSDSPAASVEGMATTTLAPGIIIRTVRERERIEVEAEAGGPALLVVNDAFWPGWTARIDGRPAPVLPVDGVVRGVPWPPGRHVLTMRYDPEEVSRGLLLGAIALAAWLGLAVTLARGLLRRRVGNGVEA